jgi:membrane associated rhomboid family serine protease
VTLGASGVVFGYATYLISRGVFNRRIGELAIGIVVAVLFGGALLSGLLPHSGISWQAHLFGGIGGVLAAQMFAAPRGGARDQLATHGADEAPTAARASRRG